jgi:lipid-binding SYLF domain-containing protein
MALSLAAAVLVATSGVAREAIANAEEEAEARDRVKAAADVLREMVRAEDADIPEALLSRAKAVAVVPHVVRGAFIVGGRWGKGVVATRAADGQWGPASFVDLSGASVGFQIGGDATDLIMVFIEEDGLEALLEDRVELGANASVAAGPIGRSGEIGTNVTLDSAIYAYSRSKGAFAGAALDGTVITIDDSANQTAFGRAIDGDVALSGAVATPEVFTPYVEAVKAVTPPMAQ